MSGALGVCGGREERTTGLVCLTCPVAITHRLTEALGRDMKGQDNGGLIKSKRERDMATSLIRERPRRQ